VRAAEVERTGDRLGDGVPAARRRSATTSIDVLIRRAAVLQERDEAERDARGPGGSQVEEATYEGASTCDGSCG
jgi:hypothetical protein